MENEKLTDDQMISDLVAQLDAGFANGVGHVNVGTEEGQAGSRSVQTMGCTDCSRTPLACSVPTFEDPRLDDYK
ncbi:MAG: hypothetical protein IKR70_03625 [Lachnospiraceae bacterium]|nr:hypothetical protein [Lachnospiraceae bacterium]